MRKILAAALAVPVIALVVARDLGRQAGIRRLSVLAAILAVGAIVAVSGTSPEATTATLPSRVASAIDPSEFQTEIRTSESPSAPVTMTFPAPMDVASVEQMIRITPATNVVLAWDERGTRLTITPTTAWRPGTYHNITIRAGALEASGAPITRHIRAAFLTRPATTGSVAATQPIGTETTVATAFRVTFSGPVDASTLDVVVSPAVEGTLVPVEPVLDPAMALDTGFETRTFDFVPSEPLQPDTEYVVAVAPGARDADGAPLVTTGLTVRTAAAPSVVRFRPRNDTAAVGWQQTLSVRFTEPMDRASTEAAWSALQGTKAIAGTFSWAEGDTVLVFDPKAVLGYSQKVMMSVGTGATSKAGLPLQAAASASFTTAKRPVKPPPTGGGGGGGGGSGGGPSIGGGTWAAVETYYLKLMNCTRTGGLVTSTGTCSSPGGRNVAALWIDAGISSKVARPYAKKLAVNNMCTHFSGGDPGDRLRAAGYTSYIWAENLGCRSGDPYAAVLGSHLYFQSERSYNGGHYVNLMNAKYDRVGIGVWVSSGRVRLVVDFYHPR